MALPMSGPMSSSSSPRMGTMGVQTNNIRQVISRQIDNVARASIDEFASFGVAGSDGRFGFPSQDIPFRDPVGRTYHVVGVSSPDDMSVASP